MFSSQLTQAYCIRPGQISASLAGMSRTIDDYDSMARREIIKAKQEKATSYVSFFIRKKSNASHIPGLTFPPLSDTTHFDRRVQKFKSDYAEFRKEFERIKEEVTENPAQLLPP